MASRLSSIPNKILDYINTVATNIYIVFGILFLIVLAIGIIGLSLSSILWARTDGGDSNCFECKNSSCIGCSNNICIECNINETSSQNNSCFNCSSTSSNSNLTFFNGISKCLNCELTLFDSNNTCINCNLTVNNNTECNFCNNTEIGTNSSICNFCNSSYFNSNNVTSFNSTINLFDSNLTCIDCVNQCNGCNNTEFDTNTSNCFLCNATYFNSNNVTSINSTITLTDSNLTCINCTNECQNCNGSVNLIQTSNSTLIPVSNTLTFSGECGLNSFIIDNNISFIDLENLSPYIVGIDSCSQFSTPQDAYNQAIIDGKGGDGAQGAIIIIKPGTYSFGSSLFSISQTGITFYGLPSGRVLFTSSSTSGGISISTNIGSETSVIFQGITFGMTGFDTIGFLLNITTGQVILKDCNTYVGNFRILMGSVNTAQLTITDCNFNPLPPNDFITTFGTASIINIQNSNFNSGLTGTKAGHFFNLTYGFNTLTIYKCNFKNGFYNGIIYGPLSGNGVTNTINFRYSTVERVNTGVQNYFIQYNGLILVNLEFNEINTVGFIFYQTLNATTSDVHTFNIFSNDLNTLQNSTVLTNLNVTILGIQKFNFYNNFISSVGVPAFLNIQTATTGDVFVVEILHDILQTSASGVTPYIQGPGSTFGSLFIFSSVQLNQATTTSGFTVTHLTGL